MVLGGSNLFKDKRQAYPIEERTTVTRENGVISMMIPGVYTSYWSCPGVSFTACNPDTDQVGHSYIHGSINTEQDGRYFTAPVYLPHGATVTGAIVYGSVSDETWELKRATLASAASGTVMATAVLNTADTTITNPGIDNATYCYWFNIESALDTGDDILGARITYTTPSVTVTGQVTINATAYSGEGQKLRGFKTTSTLCNNTGSQQTINYTITNTTQATTLKTKTGLVIADGAFNTISSLWTTDEIKHGDNIRFTMTSGNIGTAGTATEIGYCSFFVESIEETNQPT